MANKENGITYHNKDVLSKILAENFKARSLKVYGVDVPKIKQVLPTNLPELQINEMRLDNLFLLEDGSVAVIDYESDLKWENYLKYLGYIVRISGRYKKEGMPKQIRMIVIYTADIGDAPEEFSVGCLTLKLERAFLSRIDPKQAQRQVQKTLADGRPLSDDELMKLIILPLAYKGKERKQQVVKEAVELAKQITDQGQKTFVLSGILVFADKIIDDDTAEYIKGVIRMTKVEKLIWKEGREDGLEEGRREGHTEGREEGIQSMISVLKKLNVPVQNIQVIIQEEYNLKPETARMYLQGCENNNRQTGVAV